MRVEIIETSGLGDRSYVITEDVAVVIDPQRDIDRVLDVVRDRGARASPTSSQPMRNGTAPRSLPGICSTSGVRH
jgi:hypothetical protein